MIGLVCNTTTSKINQTLVTFYHPKPTTTHPHKQTPHQSQKKSFTLLNFAAPCSIFYPLEASCIAYPFQDWEKSVCKKHVQCPISRSWSVLVCPASQQGRYRAARAAKKMKVKMLICEMSLIVGVVCQGPKRGKGCYRGPVGKNVVTAATARKCWSYCPIFPGQFAISM